MDCPFEKINGLKSIFILMLPLIAALIFGGSNVYKVLFLLLIFYAAFILLEIINNVYLMPFDVDIIHKNNKTQKMHGVIWQAHELLKYHNLDDIIKIKINGPPNINFSFINNNKNDDNDDDDDSNNNNNNNNNNSSSSNNNNREELVSDQVD